MLFDLNQQAAELPEAWRSAVLGRVGAANIKVLRMDARSIADIRNEGRHHLDRVGLGARAEVQVSELSHGEQKQLELAIALAMSPRLLLLDEPMAGLGTAECARMIDLLRALKTEVTILLVEHDMDAVFALADRISVLVNGERIATGTAEEIRNNEAVRVAYLGEGDA